MPRPHRLPLLALLTLLLSAAIAAAGPVAARANTRQVTILQDQVHVLSDPVGTMAVLRSLGVTEVRIFLPWGVVAPRPKSYRRPSGFDATDPAAYPAAGWAPYDAAVQAAAGDGIGVYFDFLGPVPLWATGSAPPGIGYHNPYVFEPNAHQFGDFVRAAGTRYDGSYTPPGATAPLPSVNFWGIWNEPNYGPDLQPQAIHGIEVSPALYRGLLNSAWSALHATGHAHDTILFGETAPRGGTVPATANGMVPLRFVRALYCVDSSFQELRGRAAYARGCPGTAAASRQFRAQNPALFQASGYAAHLYTSRQSSAPNLPTPASDPDWAGLADLAKLERTLDRASADYGSPARLPIYNTEFGFQTSPPRTSCGCVFLSPATAAYYLNWSEFMMWSDPRVRSDSQYLLYDGALPGHPRWSGFSSGLLFSSGSSKADYAAFRLPLYLPVTSTHPGRRLQVWGGVRPAPYAQQDSGSSQRVLIQFQPASGGSWSTVRKVTITNSAGYFEVPAAFPSSGSVRLQWTYPTTFSFLPYATPGTVTSRVQKITVG
jgi:hypothetical protein